MSDEEPINATCSNALLEVPKGATRNVLCPCGSGRKLKRCCGSESVVKRNREQAEEEERKQKWAAEVKRREDHFRVHGKYPSKGFRSATITSMAALLLAGSLASSRRR